VRDLSLSVADPQRRLFSKEGAKETKFEVRNLRIAPYANCRNLSVAPKRMMSYKMGLSRFLERI
jgi:hypothetical protein